MPTLDYLSEFYINQNFVNIREYLMLNSYLIDSILKILIIGSLIKIFIFRRNKFEVKKNISNTIKLLFPYIINGSITMIVTFVYNLEQRITSSLISDIFLFVGILLIIYIIVIILIRFLCLKLINLVDLKKYEPIIAQIKQKFEMRVNILEEEFSTKRM